MKHIKILLLLVTFYVAISSAYADDPKLVFGGRDVIIDQSVNITVEKTTIDRGTDKESIKKTVTELLEDFKKKFLKEIQEGIDKRFNALLKQLREENKKEAAAELEKNEAIYKLQEEKKELQKVIDEQLKMILALERYIKKSITPTNDRQTIYLPFNEGIGLVFSGGKYFYINDKFQPLLTPNQYFDEARLFHNGQAIVKRNGQYHRVDAKLNRINGSELNYSFIGEFFNERAVVQKVINKGEVKYGYIKLPDYTLMGKEVNFLFAGDFRNKVAIVHTQEGWKSKIGKLFYNTRWGFIDLQGKVDSKKQEGLGQRGNAIVGIRYKDKKELLHLYTLDGVSLMADEDDFREIKIGEDGQYINNGFIIMKNEKRTKWGYMDLNKNFLYEDGVKRKEENYPYLKAEPFSKEELAVVEILDYTGFHYIKTTGMRASSNFYEKAYSFHNGFAVTKVGNGFVLININFTPVSKPYSVMTDIGDGIVGVQHNIDEGYFFINIFTRNEICEGKRYENVKVFADGVCAVKKFAENGILGKWGIIDKECNERLFMFDGASSDKFKGGRFKFKSGNVEKCIDIDGNECPLDLCD